MAFRQDIARRVMRKPLPSSCDGSSAYDDPLTYVLRISGVMVMVFGVVIAGMVTLMNFG
ncbi:hypothetical protein OKW76_12460 [Sphingomonas sp. S1-29]|uniref:hypothetical protein n=1 Tax=Sphingomonas sp. S1-29 TaxID=2991074 RepID=UPI0022407E3D|nr:hypothetical protein [Sphingomonas sp. S1-29]UZK68842.1 hypothetical protein OKW76_12460 [Sphingomonas sp. S1-29]